MRGSSCLSEPAAALRGLANGSSPAALRSRVQLLESGLGEVDLAADLQHLRQQLVAPHGSRAGMLRMVRRLAVMSSPVVPSPRVAPHVNTPFS